MLICYSLDLGGQFKVFWAFNFGTLFFYPSTPVQIKRKQHNKYSVRITVLAVRATARCKSPFSMSIHHGDMEMPVCSSLIFKALKTCKLQNFSLNLPYNYNSIKTSSKTDFLNYRCRKIHISSIFIWNIWDPEVLPSWTDSVMSDYLKIHNKLII